MWTWTGIETNNYENFGNKIIATDLYTLRTKINELQLKNRCTVDFKVVLSVFFADFNSNHFTTDKDLNHLTDRKAFMQQYYEGTSEFLKYVNRSGPGYCPNHATSIINAPNTDGKDAYYYPVILNRPAL